MILVFFSPYKQPPSKASTGKLAESAQKRPDALSSPAYKTHELFSAAAIPQIRLKVSSPHSNGWTVDVGN